MENAEREAVDEWMSRGGVGMQRGLREGRWMNGGGRGGRVDDI